MGAAFVSGATYCRGCRGPRDRYLGRKKPQRRTSSGRIVCSCTDGRCCAGWLVSAIAEGMPVSNVIAISAHAVVDRANLGNCSSQFEASPWTDFLLINAAACRKSLGRVKPRMFLPLRASLDPLEPHHPGCGFFLGQPRRCHHGRLANSPS